MITIGMKWNVDQLKAQFAADTRRMERAVKAGMSAAKEPLRAAVQAETKAVFHVKQQGFLRTWTISANTVPGTIIIRNRAKGFSLHAMGGSIGPRKGSAVLIPINTAGGTSIGQKKLYKLLSWLRERNMTLFKNGILYVKPPMNTSRRGGVAIGTRVQKGFRRRLSGTFERPSGFDIKLNAQGLTAIAVVKRSITMRKRFDMDRLARNTLVPIVISSIAAELARSK